MEEEFFKDSGSELVLEFGSIDYHLLVVAQKMFARNGFKVINVPWRVPIVYQQETTDVDLEIGINCEADIGSAEQGFIYLDHLGKLGKGFFQATTPCFRNEPELDKFHLPYFMKLELYINDPIYWNADYVSSLTDYVISRYKHWILTYFECDPTIEKVQTKDGFDIEINGIEVGSYGLRHSKKLDISWVYGTGIALPRFTIGLNNE